MAGSLNKAVIIGNLGKNPEAKTFSNGNKIVSFSVATSESWKDKQTGETKERTQWHNVVLENDGLAGVAEAYLSKGSKVYIEGKMVTRKYQDQQGFDRQVHEVRVGFTGKLIILSKKAESSGGYNEEDYNQPKAEERKETDYPMPGPGEDDEIPF